MLHLHIFPCCLLTLNFWYPMIQAWYQALNLEEFSALESLVEFLCAKFKQSAGILESSLVRPIL